jgi:hypothetical protein
MKLKKYIKTGKIIQLISIYEIRRLINSFGWEEIKNICFQDEIIEEEINIDLPDATYSPELHTL